MELKVMAKKSRNLWELMENIKLPLYMVKMVKVGTEKLDSLILTEEVTKNKLLMPGDNIVFYSKNMVLFPMDFASDT